MKMKKVAFAVSALLMVSTTAMAEFSANIGATSNYVFRGVTLSGDDAAVSGGLDYAHDSGFYAGTWASSLGGGGEEVDLYAGYGGSFGDIGYDVNVYYYWYPSWDDSDYTEISGSLSYGPVTAGISYTVDSQVKDVSGTPEGFIEGDIYYFISASFEVAPTWTIGGTVGYYDFDDDGVANTDLSYTHYQLDIGKSAGDFGDFTLSVAMVDDMTAIAGDDDPIVFVSWNKTF